MESKDIKYDFALWFSVNSQYNSVSPFILILVT